MAWTPRDTASGNFADYMYNSLNEYSEAVGLDTSNSNYNLWDKYGDDSRENIYNLALAKMQNDWQRQENTTAWQRNIDMINSQNEYNSPKNQMSRYLDAGLNPNVIYGQISSGNQQGVANYDPARMVAPTFKSNRYQKLDKAMDVLSTLANIIGQGAQLAGQIEGVKNQSLQNELLQLQMPYLGISAESNAYIDQMRRFALEDLQPRYDENNNLISPGDPQKAFDILWPQGMQARGNRARAQYQEWWNEKIAPIYLSRLQGQATTAEQDAAIAQYNREMLEALPPAVRPWVQIGLAILDRVFGAKNAFAPTKAQ